MHLLNFFRTASRCFQPRGFGTHLLEKVGTFNDVGILIVLLVPVSGAFGVKPHVSHQPCYPFPADFYTSFPQNSCATNRCITAFVLLKDFKDLFA